MARRVSRAYSTRHDDPRFWNGVAVWAVVVAVLLAIVSW